MLFRSGEPATVNHCTSDGCFQPFYALGGTPLTGGQWFVYQSGTNNLVVITPANTWSQCFDLEAFAIQYNYYGDLDFVHILNMADGCGPGMVPVTVNIYHPIDTGEDAQVAFCETNPEVDMLDLLNGTPQSGQFWTNQYGDTLTTSMFNPGDYTANQTLEFFYSGGLLQTSCNSVTQLSITILPEDSYAGEDTEIDLCQSDLSILMTNELDVIGGPVQLGGSWVNLADYQIYGNYFVPGDNPPGIYEFMYNIASDCGSDFSTLTINLGESLDPGTSGTLAICDNESLSLFDGLSGSPVPGGTWTLSGVSVPETVNGSTVANGAIYTYTVGVSPCLETSTVTINRIISPNAGVLTTIPQVFCDSGGEITLMELFDIDPSVLPAPGVAGWTGPGAMGGVTSVNPADGSSVSGIYTYTIQNTGCGAASTSINITIEDTPNAGIDGILDICPNATGTTNLFGSLGAGAVAGGSWTGPSGLFSGNFNPAANDPAGVYTYTVGTNCTDDATVTVSYITLPNPGTSSNHTVCAGDPAFNLIDHIGAGAVEGTWSFDGNSVSSVFTPGTSTPGIYTNTVSAGTCPSVTATLNVIVTPLPNAGIDASTTYCATQGNVDLTSDLDGNPLGTGSWTDASNNPVSNPFALNSVTCGNTYVYTYTVGSGTCSAFSTLTFDVVCPPDAGSNGAIDHCSTDGTFSLYDGLTGTYDAGGTWTTGGTAVPNPTAMNPATMGTGGTYTYTVNAAPCASASADVVVSITPAMSSANLTTTCTASFEDYILSFNITGGQAPYAIASGDPGTITGNTYTSDPITAGAGYSVEISDNSGCTDLTVSGVSPICECPVEASFISGDDHICAGGNTNLIFDLSGGAGGVYSFVYSDGTNTYPVSGANDNHSLSVSPINTTTYTLISVSDGDCDGTVSGSITVTVDQQLMAGVGQDIDVCATDAVFSLFDGLTSYDTPGTWTNSSNDVVTDPTNMNPATMGTGDTFTYTINVPPCDPSNATVQVNITPAMSSANLTTTCTASFEDYILTFEITGGQAPYAVASGDPGTITGNTYTSDPITAGAGYSVEISDNSGCTDITVSGVSPICECPVEASFTSGDATICEGESTNLVFNLTGGTPGNYIIEYSEAGTTLPAVSVISNGHSIPVSPATTTTYTLVSVSDGACVGTVSGSVTITVDEQNNAGIDVSVPPFCAAATPLNLIDVVPAGQPTNGTFSPASIPLTPASSGDYNYTVSGGQCADDIAVYSIEIQAPLSVTSLQAPCEPNQTEYTVTFTINGGSGPGTYTVDGVLISGNTFTSELISMPNGYSFVINDMGPCGEISRSGPAPDCSCPVSASFASTDQSICIGDAVDVEIDLFGGIDGNYTFVYNDGTGPITVLGASDGDVIPVSPTVTTTYTLISVTDGDCFGNASGTITISVDQLNNAGIDVSVPPFCAAATPLNLIDVVPAGQPTNGTFSPASIPLTPASSGDYNYTVSGGQCPDDIAVYTIEIQAPLSVTAVQASCEPNQTEYTVTFTINGGSGPGTYTVGSSGNAGTISGNTFTTSAPININDNYSIEIGDSGPCDAIEVIGDAPDCNCQLNASFASGSETICVGSEAMLEFNLSGGIDGNYTFVYNDGTGPITVPGASDGHVIPVSPTTTTTYTLVNVSDGNCDVDVSGSVTITVEQLPNAGTDIALNDQCGDGTQFTFQPGLGQPTGGTFSPASITLLPANSGDYTYTMAGNQCPDDEATYSIAIIPQMTVSSQSSVCSPSQLEYTVSFTVAGGTPPYSIDNGPLTSDPNFEVTLNYASNPDYSFTISDSGPCGDLTVLGDAPDCSCFAQGSISGSTTLCLGESTQIMVNLSGDGPFDIEYTSAIPGSPTITTPLSSINNGHLITVDPSSTATYTLTQINDSHCEGNITGSPVTVTVNTPITLSNETQICGNTGETYQVQFNYTGGVAPYTFSPANSPSSPPGVYLSAVPIASGSGYNITANDSGVCGGTSVSNAGYTCVCISDAGTITSAPLNLCYDETVTLSTNGSETLDGNDVLQYILHDGGANAIGNIIGTSSNGEFTFDYTTMTPGTVYYIHAVVGNNLGNGNVDLNDICLSLSNGIEVVMSTYPTLSISGGAIVCPGEPVDLTITPTGEGPWDFEYAVDGITQAMQTITEEFTLTVTQPATYTLVSISDNNCPGIVSGTAIVGNHVTPTATLSSEPSVCANSGDGAQIALTGAGPWTFIYSINGVEQAPITSSSSTYTIPAEVNGTYALVSVEGVYCAGTVSGSQNITILPAPTASITGGGSVCEGDFGTFELSLTGSAPYTVKYTIGGIPQSPLTGITDGYTFDSTVGGDYVLVSVSDANCSGEVLSSQASLTVSPSPTANITTNKNSVCIGETVTLGINLEGVPPFIVTYVINGDTTTATGLYSNFVKTLSPTNPINFEVIYVSDGSNPACSSNPQEFAYIDAVVLPNAPILTNDTICSYDGPVMIGVSPAPGLTYTWSPETHLSSPNSSRTTFQPTATGPYAKNFEYVLTATNGMCTASDTMTITVDPGPKPYFEFTPDPVLSEDPTVYFKNKTIGRPDLIYFWEIDALQTSHEYEPWYKFPDGINDTYNITLTAIDPLTGCLNSISRRLEVKPQMLIYVPNAFTPDGDGKNDVWGPVLSNVDKEDYKLTVMDRLGEIVFTTTDINQKWNGSFMNDSYFVQPGVYVWIIETKNIISLDEVTMKGIVTLVR